MTVPKIKPDGPISQRSKIHSMNIPLNFRVLFSLAGRSLASLHTLKWKKQPITARIPFQRNDSVDVAFILP